MRKIGVVGAGHIGLVTAACFAEMGNSVICCDNDKEKIKKLNEMKIPFYEPELEGIVKKNFKNKKLSF